MAYLKLFLIGFLIGTIFFGGTYYLVKSPAHYSTWKTIDGLKGKLT